MIIDGKKIAGEILAATRVRVAALGRAPVVRAITVSPNAATESYLRIKSARAEDAGMHLEVISLPHSATTEDVILALGGDATIVQLPLPPSIDTTTVLNSIPITQDADVLSRVARALFEQGDSAIFPPVVAAVKEILMRANVSAKDKKAVVIGKGWLVGEPVATWLTQQGAKVTTFTKESVDLAGTLLDADIIVSGAGVGHLIQPSMIKQGVVLIDAGTSESGGALVGDADPDCANTASVFTPVPGGVGPIAVACLFANVAELLTKGK